MNSTEDIVIDGSLGADLVSKTFDVSRYNSFALHAVITGSPVGTISIQGSNVNSPADFEELNSGSIAVSGAGNYIYENETALRYVRLVYTRTSGSGVINLHASAKE